jgi:hypothetical protein
MTGMIQSHNFPGDYPKMQNCKWTVEFLPNLEIFIKFNYFYLERGGATECYDSLSIYSTPASSHGDYCFF